MLGRGVRSFADARHSGAYDRAGVGHGSDNRDFFSEALFDIRSRHGSRDRDHQRVLTQFRFDFLQHVADDLGLHAKDHDVGATNGLAIVGGGGNAKFLGERGGLLFVAYGRRDVFRCEEILLQIGAKQDSAEFACAEDGEFLAGEFAGHDANIVTEARGRVNKRLRMGWDRMRGTMRNHRAIGLVGLGLLILSGARLFGFARDTNQAAESRVVLKNVAVPMRDGVALRADVWLPKEEGRFPTLVYRTPYGKQDAPKEWSTFEKLPARGYAVVIQDVRGRYASDGEFLPYQNEGKDGYDTIEWGNVRAVVPWGGAVAGRCRESTAFEGDGTGDDIFHAAKLFLLGRIV